MQRVARVPFGLMASSLRHEMWSRAALTWRCTSMSSCHHFSTARQHSESIAVEGEGTDEQGSSRGSCVDTEFMSVSPDGVAWSKTIIAHLKQIRNNHLGALHLKESFEGGSSWEDALQLVCGGAIPTPRVEGDEAVVSSSGPPSSCTEAEMCVTLQWLLFTCMQVRAPAAVCDTLYQALRQYSLQGQQEGDFPRDPFHPRGLYYHYAWHLLKEYYTEGHSIAARATLLDTALRVLLADSPTDGSACARRPSSLLLVLEALRQFRLCSACNDTPASQDSCAILSWLHASTQTSGAPVTNDATVARACLECIFSWSSDRKAGTLQHEAMTLYVAFLLAREGAEQIGHPSPYTQASSATVRKLRNAAARSAGADHVDPSISAARAEEEQGQLMRLLDCSDEDWGGDATVQRVIGACRLAASVGGTSDLPTLSLCAFIRELLAVTTEGQAGVEWWLSDEHVRRRMVDTLAGPHEMVVVSTACPFEPLLVHTAHTTTRLAVLLMNELRLMALHRNDEHDGAAERWHRTSRKTVALLRLLAVAVSNAQRATSSGAKRYDAQQELWYVILRGVEEGCFSTAEGVAEVGVMPSVIHDLVLPLYSRNNWRRPTVNIFVRVLQQWGMDQQLREVFSVINRREAENMERSANAAGGLMYRRHHLKIKPALTLASCEVLLSRFCSVLEDPRSAADVIKYMLVALQAEQVQTDGDAVETNESKNETPEPALAHEYNTLEHDATADAVTARQDEGDTEGDTEPERLTAAQWANWIKNDCIPRVDELFKRKGLDSSGNWLNS